MVKSFLGIKETCFQSFSRPHLISTSHTTEDMAMKELTLLALVAVAVFCTVSASRYHNHGNHYGKGLISYIPHPKIMVLYSIFFSIILGQATNVIICTERIHFILSMTLANLNNGICHSYFIFD